MAAEEPKMGRLKRIPLRITGSWTEKTVTTDPPRYIPHTEYALSFHLRSDEEFLIAFVLLDNGKGDCSRTWRSSALREWRIDVAFHPRDWRCSNVVQVNFEGVRTEVDFAEFKRDPRPFVLASLLDGKSSATTGECLTLARIVTQPQIECCILAVVKSDTIAKRGRWRLRPSLAADVPNEFQFLREGRVTVRS